MTNMESAFVKNTIHSLWTNVALIGLGFVLNLLQARWLGPEGKGGYDLFVATGGLLMIALGFPAPSGVSYITASSPVSLPRMARWLLRVALVQGLVILFLLGVAERSGVLWTFLPRWSNRGIIVISAVYVFLTILTSYWRAILIGQLEIISANRIFVLTRLADLLLFLGLLGWVWVFGQSLDLPMVIYLLLISALISNGLCLYRLRVPLMATSQGISGFRQAVKYSVPCYLGSLILFLNTRLDMFLISALMDQKAVGLYALSANLAHLVWLLSISVAKALLPKVASEQHLPSRNAYLTAQATRLSFYLSFIAGILLSLFSIAALPLVYGDAFRGSIAPLLWLMPGVVAIGSAFILAAYIAGIGKPQINSYILFVGLLATVTLDLVLIPRFGIAGAAFASTLSFLISTGLTLWFFMRNSGIHIQNIFLLTPEDIRLAISLSRMISHRVRLRNAG